MILKEETHYIVTDFYKDGTLEEYINKTRTHLKLEVIVDILK